MAYNGARHWGSSYFAARYFLTDQDAPPVNIGSFGGHARRKKIDEEWDAAVLQARLDAEAAKSAIAGATPHSSPTSFISEYVRAQKAASALQIANIKAAPTQTRSINAIRLARHRQQIAEEDAIVSALLLLGL